MSSAEEVGVSVELLEDVKKPVENENNLNREKHRWCVDWTEARKEFSWQKLWTERLWSDIAGNFVKVFILSLIPTLFDVGTDYFSAKSFIMGANYTKNVPTLPDPNNTGNLECAHIAHISKTNIATSETATQEEILCFEKDPIWGAVCALFIFLPGMMVTAKVVKEVSRVRRKITAHLWGLLSLPITLPFFPLIVISGKLVALVNPGPEWKKIVLYLTACEGRWESTTQFVLNLFIIFTRADMSPSTIQLVSWQVP